MGGRFRRISQIASLILFVWLVVRVKFLHSSGIEGYLAYQANPFFKLDPVTALISAAAGRTFYSALLWSFLILLPTLLLGRFFCGWICPMGSLNHILSRIGSEPLRRKRMIATNRYRKWQTTKYVLLIVGIVAALYRCNIVSWIDPFCWLVRSMGLSVLPSAASRKYFVVYQPHYGASLLLCALCLALLAMNLRVTRFWCRALCPLGALLGMASRCSILELHKDASSCTRCNRCSIDCQGGDDPIGGTLWHKAECHLCLNCIAACPHGALQFRFFRKAPQTIGTSLHRRNVLVAVAISVFAVPIIKARTLLGKRHNERLIRPPGALREAEFLARCIRCGECMRVCPNNALQPTLAEAGLEGLWSPAVLPKIGYCESNCVLCTEVCPTGAIQKLTPQEKGWTPEAGQRAVPVRLGIAVYDRGRCLPWAAARANLPVRYKSIPACT